LTAVIGCQSPDVPDDPAVALTGYDNQERREQAEAAGIDFYRLTPISTAILNDVFERLSDKSAGNSMRCRCARKLPHCRCVRNRKA